MRAHIRRVLSREPRDQGQALVEFTLVVPIFLLLLLGIVEFGLILYNQHVITNASREGARYGIVVHSPRRDTTEIRIVVDEYCLDNMVTFGPAVPLTLVTPQTTTAGATFGQDLTVEVTFHYAFLVFPEFLGDLFGGMDLRATTTMKYE